jgi:hypothetical protein
MSGQPIYLWIASVVLCAACNTGSREQLPTQTSRNPDAEVLALKLSQACSTAAETFWNRNGYDHPGTPANGTTETWDYRSHYNTEQKRCLVRVERVAQLPSGPSIRSEEVFDAIEDGEPLASLSVTRFAPDVESRWDLLKANMAIPSTSENLDWYWGLMSK